MNGFVSIINVNDYVKASSVILRQEYSKEHIEKWNPPGYDLTKAHLSIYRVAHKTVRHTSHNMWMQQLVSVYEVTSPEKNDTKISNFGSVVCFLGHIYLYEKMSRPKM